MIIGGVYLKLNDINFSLNITDLGIITYTLKILFLCMYTYYTFLKILNIKTLYTVYIMAITIIISIISGIIKSKIDSWASVIFIVLSLSVLYSVLTKNKIGFSILNTVLALSINYILFFVAVVISYLPNKFFVITNDFISLFLIMIIHLILLFYVFKIKRFKNGFIFLKDKSKDEYFNLLMLNISVIILFSSIIITNMNLLLIKKLFFSFIAFSAIMFITIQKTLTMYYKHKLLVKELEETKLELEKKNKEISELEKENLNFSKTSHSIAHKQKSLEYKLNKLLLKTEIASEIDIRNKVNEISEQCFNQVPVIELSKTNIPEIDDMLSFMQSECTKNNIEFDLQLNGNIYTMINNFISKEDLEILIADHVKNAIIAINYSDNINRSILVRLGMIDGCYSLYIYDSGIEFEINTLANLGKKPSTTHSDNGGTGMGFMNTFDTLRKYQASIYINENSSPTADDFTKFIVIKFDNQNKFETHSYRAQKMKNLNINFIIKNI